MRSRVRGANLELGLEQGKSCAAKVALQKSPIDKTNNSQCHADPWVLSRWGRCPCLVVRR
jgi:hypothetical protein